RRNKSTRTAAAANFQAGRPAWPEQIAMSQNSRSTKIPGIRWRDPSGSTYQIVAMIYIATMYGFGLIATVSPSLLFNIAGTVALAHSLIIAAYLLHECAHQSVFISAKHNARLGSVLAWLTGACYSGF